MLKVGMNAYKLERFDAVLLTTYQKSKYLWIGIFKSQIKAFHFSLTLILRLNDKVLNRKTFSSLVLLLYAIYATMGSADVKYTLICELLFGVK